MQRITYRNCLKNHASSMGGNALDGCGEFMPSGGGGTLEALKCAACSCHRDFHRKELHDEAAMVHPVSQYRGVRVPSMNVALGGGMESYNEEQPATKKRHRTKFTVVQKEKMLGFAEKVGWKIPKENDAELQRFCSEVGVTRYVFKVWMYNNCAAKKTLQQQDQCDGSNSPINK